MRVLLVVAVMLVGCAAPCRTAAECSSAQPGEPCAVPGGYNACGGDGGVIVTCNVDGGISHYPCRDCNPYMDGFQCTQHP